MLVGSRMAQPAVASAGPPGDSVCAAASISARRTSRGSCSRLMKPSKRAKFPAIRSSCSAIIRSTPSSAGCRSSSRRSISSTTIPGPMGASRVTPNMRMRDIQKLASCLFHSQVHVNVASTMAVDGAIFDRPQIGPAYDDTPGRKYDRPPGICTSRNTICRSRSRAAWKSCTAGTNWFGPFAPRLEDPGRLAEGRKRLVREICTFDDGRATERVAQAVRSFIEQHVAAGDDGGEVRLAGETTHESSSRTIEFLDDSAGAPAAGKTAWARCCFPCACRCTNGEGMCVRSARKRRRGCGLGNRRSLRDSAGVFAGGSSHFLREPARASMRTLDLQRCFRRGRCAAARHLPVCGRTLRPVRSRTPWKRARTPKTSTPFTGSIGRAATRVAAAFGHAGAQEALLAELAAVAG